MCKIDIFLQKSSSLLLGMDQTNQVYNNDDQGVFYQICKFYEPRGRSSCAMAWPYKKAFFSTLSIYSTLNAIVLRD